MNGSQSVMIFSGSTTKGDSVRTTCRSVRPKECMYAGSLRWIAASRRGARMPRATFTW